MSSETLSVTQPPSRAGAPVLLSDQVSGPGDEEEQQDVRCWRGNNKIRTNLLACLSASVQFYFCNKLD